MRGHGRRPGAQGPVSASARRLLAAADEEEVLVKPKQGESGRNYTGKTKVLSEGPLKGATMRAFNNGRHTLWDLDPDSYDAFPWAAKHTSRRASGEAVYAPIRSKEAAGGDLQCLRCFRKTGQPVLGPNGNLLYNLRTCHFRTDHMLSYEPSWWGRNIHGNFAEQVHSGAAQTLCNRCEADRAYDALPGQGTSHKYDEKAEGVMVKKRKVGKAKAAKAAKAAKKPGKKKAADSDDGD